jgi:hypothetical protein
VEKNSRAARGRGAVEKGQETRPPGVVHGRRFYHNLLDPRSEKVPGTNGTVGRKVFAGYGLGREVIRVQGDAR